MGQGQSKRSEGRVTGRGGIWSCSTKGNDSITKGEGRGGEGYGPIEYWTSMI